MNERIKTNWWSLFIIGIIFLVLSVKIMTHPVASILGLAVFIGWACLISGVLQIGYSLSSKDAGSNRKWRLFNGVINLVFGIIFLSHPTLTAQALPFIFGFWMIFIGITTFFHGIKETDFNVSGGWFDMLLGVIITIGGIWISYNPAMEAILLTWLLSLVFMFYGFYFVVGSVMLARLK